MKRINLSLLILFLIPNLSFGFANGITGYSGQTGQTCTNCHTGGTTPTVSLAGNTSITPGSTVSFSLNLSGGQQNLGGFGISVDGGTLINTLGNIANLTSGELTHAQAINVGTAGGQWSFDWQAPTTQGIYHLYASSVSADGNGSPTGDAAAADSLTLVVSATGNVPPSAAFQAPSTVIQGAVVNFDANSSSDPDGQITAYDWNFGDGSLGTGVTTTHTFSTTGTFVVSLAVTDDGGLSQTASKSIKVVAAGTPIPPTADIGGPYSAEQGADITFDANASMDTDGTIQRYLWDFGDGSAFAEGANPVHSFTSPGSYTVTLAVTDNDGLTNAVATTVEIGAQLTGQQLFNQYCSGCHNTGSGGDVTGTSANKIRSAINGVNEMNGIVLSDPEIDRIAQFLNSGGSGGGGGGGGGTTGESLYIQNCQACHGVGGVGGPYRGVQNVTAADINRGIANVALMNNIALSAADIDLIVGFLNTGGGGGGGGGGSTGETLYGLHCQSCHGAGGAGGPYRNVQGISVADINTGIANVAQMNNISLTNAELTAIVEYLATSTGGGGGNPTTGDGLYNQFCSGCHGAEGAGNTAVAVIGATSSRITSAIGSIGAMSGISLTGAEIDLIAAYLATVAKPTTGQGLFQAFCDSCHGPNGNEGNVDGSSASKIADEIQNTQEMNFLDGVLTNEEISLIADYLNSGSGGD